MTNSFFILTAIRSGDYYMFDEFDDELDSIVEKDNELSDDSLEDSDKTDTDPSHYQVINFLIFNREIKLVFTYNFNFSLRYFSRKRK